MSWTTSAWGAKVATSRDAVSPWAEWGSCRQPDQGHFLSPAVGYISSMRIGVINIGDELLGGKILNTNQFDLSRIVSPLGHSVAFSLVVGDEEADIARALDLASGSLAPAPADLLVLTGGLGPTRDDITRQAVASWLGRPLLESPEALAWLEEIFAGMAAFVGRPKPVMGEGQRNQAFVPEGTRPLRNPAGTACGF